MGSSANDVKKWAFAAGLGVAVAGGVVAAALYLHYGDDDQLESATSRPVAIDVRIPVKHKGIVIGRGGANVREIQEKTRTRIHFKDELETEEHCTIVIRGQPDEAQLAEILIQQTIANQPRLETLEMFVPATSTGRIIGRGGEVIRGMQKQSRCRIDMERGGINLEGMKRILLKGTSEQVDMAKRLIESKVAEEAEMKERIQRTAESRPPRLKHKQPLFLTSESETETDPASNKQTQEQLCPMSADNLMDVFVSAISYPDSFYVQKIGPKSVELDKLVQAMTQFYDDPINEEAHRITEVQVGDIVAAKFSGDGSWYRAKVIEVTVDEYDDSKVEVDLDFVDFGDCERKSLSEVLDLRTDFLKLSFQAIECAMADIAPKNGSTWTTEACDDFERLTHSAQWVKLLAKIVDYKKKGNAVVPYIQLFDTNPKDQDINIGQELVNLGHAVFCQKPAGEGGSA